MSNVSGAGPFFQKMSNVSCAGPFLPSLKTNFVECIVRGVVFEAKYRSRRGAVRFLEVEPELEESELGLRSPTQKVLQMARSLCRTASFGLFVGFPP